MFRIRLRVQKLQIKTRQTVFSHEKIFGCANINLITQNFTTLIIVIDKNRTLLLTLTPNEPLLGAVVAISGWILTGKMRGAPLRISINACMLLDGQVGI